MEKVEVAIIGAGPAGLSCAMEAARLGAKVVVLDENQKPGGQLFKQIHKFFGSKEHKAGVRGFRIGEELLEYNRKLGVNVLLNAEVYGIYGDKNIAYIKDGYNHLLSCKKLVLATGATENTLAFPGCTLPGVMGAGAAQTMMNINRVLPGNRVITVGSGNVGLIVSYQLLQAGAEVVALVEALSKISGYDVHAAKILRAGVPIFTSATVKEAFGKEKVEEVVLMNLKNRKELKIKVDTICLAVGLTPLTELAWLTGCKFIHIKPLGGHIPIHDDNMQTSIDGVYVAGDISGIEEASTAMEEGRLAGISCAESLGHISSKKAERLKNKVWRRLNALRTGPFGKARYESKLKILNSRKGITS